MGSLQFTDLQSRPTEFLDFTSLTLDEFQQLVPPFEAAFQAHMAAWRLDGKPRTARRFAVYKTCPLAVTDCNQNQPGLQSPRFQDHIICIYRPCQNHIICN
jgi:hypothetical protein